MLHQKKYRDAHGLFPVEGEKCVKEAILNKAKIKEVYATPEWIASLDPKTGLSNVHEVSQAELQKICQQKNPNAALAIVEQQDHKLDIDSLKGRVSIALESVRDPGNLGTIIRIADWYGIDNILVTSDSVERYNHKVIQSSMGGIFRVKIHECSLEETLSKASTNGAHVLGAVMDGRSIQESECPEGAILLFGNESKGISPALRSVCNELIRIDGAGKAESLNVGVAAGIISHWACS
jgi:TrmH family RNA methyltransferase